MILREDFIRTLGMPDEGFTGAVDAALRQVKEREARPIMKRKMICALLAAVIMMMALAGAALAVGLNLFDYFGREDQRLRDVAPQAVVEDAVDIEIDTEALGVTKAKIDSAYYDGQSLIAAYTVDNYRGYERFEPTEAELKEMTECGEYVPDDDEAAESFRAAVEAREPFGIVEYAIAVGDPCRTDDGVELPPSDTAVESVEDGPLYCIFEFETPLPEAAQNRDSLKLVLPVKLYTAWHWFDGEKTYARYAQEPLTELTATVARAGDSAR